VSHEREFFANSHSIHAATLHCHSIREEKSDMILRALYLIDFDDFIHDIRSIRPPCKAYLPYALMKEKPWENNEHHFLTCVTHSFQR
jgi:hypothetical protein